MCVGERRRDHPQRELERGDKHTREYQGVYILMNLNISAHLVSVMDP